ncbi:hypothetical protein HELRODRAFT_180357 [Helobdella robusta]|uniref:Uncharacterized protein n=1 Tax=Helobdella robusta TaxID=6412 RepID=T1FFT5_HELRO|nr:hypothetical protein HELRODRAFT_180357 [Helobdella robusta]ESN93948.1 hypothetical protein HELRODRAFT_180357 [Helobdella robusta]
MGDRYSYDSAAVDAKIIQHWRELREQLDVKAEQQSAVINAKIENQMMRMEDITSKIEQKFDQKVIGFEQKLSCEVDKLKQELEETKKINSTPVSHRTTKTLKVSAFDGETSWNINKAQFETAAMNFGWNIRKRTTALVVALRGLEAEDLQTIPVEKYFNYDVLVNALILRYGEEHMRQIYRSQLRNWTQRNVESIQQLSQDIELLTQLSYPHVRPTTQRTNCIGNVCKGCSRFRSLTNLYTSRLF